MVRPLFAPTVALESVGNALCVLFVRLAPDGAPRDCFFGDPSLEDDEDEEPAAKAEPGGERLLFRFSLGRLPPPPLPRRFVADVGACESPGALTLTPEVSKVTPRFGGLPRPLLGVPPPRLPLLLPPLPLPPPLLLLPFLALLDEPPSLELLFFFRAPGGGGPDGGSGPAFCVLPPAPIRSCLRVALTAAG